jgi:hypothetical protein
MTGSPPSTDPVRHPTLATPRALSLAIRGFALAYGLALRARVLEPRAPLTREDSERPDDGTYPFF